VEIGQAAGGDPQQPRPRGAAVGVEAVGSGEQLQKDDRDQVGGILGAGAAAQGVPEHAVDVTLVERRHRFRIGNAREELAVGGG
jgi:hypothetical protein